MRNKVDTITVIILSLVMIIVVTIVENNSISPMERFRERNTSNKGIELSKDNEANNERIDKSSRLLIDPTNTLQYELISYEIIDDINIAKQTKYPAEFFYEGEIPDPNSLTVYIDYDSMRQDYPEFAEYQDSFGMSGMTDEEYLHFWEQHVSEYSTSIHPKTKYIFVRCKITFLGGSWSEKGINDLRVFVMCENQTTGEVELNCYFDHPQHTGEDDRNEFFIYSFNKAGETIDCVVGFEITEDTIDFSKDYSLYLGFEPLNLDDITQINLLTDKRFVAMDTLEEVF